MAAVSFENNFKTLKNKGKKPFYFKRKKKPLVLVFDEKEREEFLTGFRKRKLQRKKKAQEDLEVQLKAERKRIRLEAKDALKKLVVSHRDLPALEQVYEDADIVDMDTHEVQVTELDPAQLARENNWIGANQIKYDEICKTKELSDEEGIEEIPGMETKKKKNRETNNSYKDIKTAKDVKKYVKKVATKNVQKSKIFQKKKDVEKIKNRKKKMREERSREKTLKKTKNERDRRK